MEGEKGWGWEMIIFALAGNVSGSSTLVSGVAPFNGGDICVCKRN